MHSYIELDEIPEKTNQSLQIVHLKLMERIIGE